MYEGTPHGNAKLAYSENVLMLNPISFFMNVFYLHLRYTRYAARFFPDFALPVYRIQSTHSCGRRELADSRKLDKQRVLLKRVIRLLT